MRLAVLATLFVLMTSTVAKAGILVEPYAKYSLGVVQATTIGNITSQWKANGIGAGARLGFAGRHLFLVGDYGMVFSGKLQADGGAATDADNLKETQIGAVLGLRFGVLRIFGGYNFTNELSADSSGVTTTFHGGHGAKVGVGLDFHPVAINVEYVQSTYDQVKVGGADSSIRDAGYSEVKGHAIVASLSFPLGF